MNLKLLGPQNHAYTKRKLREGQNTLKFQGWKHLCVKSFHDFIKRKDVNGDHIKLFIISIWHDNPPNTLAWNIKLTVHSNILFRLTYWALIVQRLKKKNKKKQTFLQKRKLRKKPSVWPIMIEVWNVKYWKIIQALWCRYLHPIARD